MAQQQVHYSTGRRKSSTARVYLMPGTGNITVNRRPLDQYFGRVPKVENEWGGDPVECARTVLKSFRKLPR